jgi:hypothetical protein
MASGAVAPDVPIQYFQSIIAIELVVAGAQLFQIRYFDKGAEPGSGSDPRLRLLMAIVLMSTVVRGSGDRGLGSWSAQLVTVGLAKSLLPILVKVLPPLSRDIETQRHDPHPWVTVVGCWFMSLS